MPCGSCVDKLAIKLMKHHKIDMIRAYELAEKGMERFETRPSEVESGNPTDYTKACVQGTCDLLVGSCTKEGFYCTTNTQCVGGSCQVTGSCACPAPLPNSHQVSGCTVTCAITSGTCAKCSGNECVPTCQAVSCSTGNCGYDCDVGYTWNPVTLTCELPVTVKFQGDGLTWVTS